MELLSTLFVVQGCIRKPLVNWELLCYFCVYYKWTSVLYQPVQFPFFISFVFFFLFGLILVFLWLFWSLWPHFYSLPFPVPPLPQPHLSQSVYLYPVIGIMILFIFSFIYLWCFKMTRTLSFSSSCYSWIMFVYTFLSVGFMCCGVFLKKLRIWYHNFPP